MPANIKKYLFPAIYILAIVLLVIYALNTQNITRQSADSPLYRNLMDNEAYIKRGFNIKDIGNLSTDYTDFHKLNPEWYRYEKQPLNVRNSPLPDLPKRIFLSPFGNEPEEFTIKIPVEFDNRVITYLNTHPNIVPGIYLAAIGEKWEIYFNGELVQSGMSNDRKGRLQNRTWRNVYFPFEKTLIVLGTNTVTLRIIGDPAYEVTGLTFISHHYIDNYRLIEKRNLNFHLIVFCGIFGFTGLYYIMLFLFLKKRSEIFNLYFGIFSLLLCIYTFVRHSIINSIIPNADIVMRIDYVTMKFLMPLLCLFIETYVRGKASRISYYYLAFCSVLAVTQIFFSNQFGEDSTILWSVILIIYGLYFIIKLIYSLRKENPNAINDTHITIAVIGMLCVYLSGVYEIVQIFYFEKNINIFQYSLIAIHLVMAFNLAERFSGMYKKLEEKNIILDTTVKERTAELAEQTEIAVELSVAKSKFLATVNNELKTPLENISADIQLAKEKAENEEAKDLIQKAWDNTMQMASNVSNAIDELQKTKSSADNVKIGNLSFDLVSYRTFYNSMDLLLTPKEFSLLYMLARNERKSLSAKELYETVWKLPYSDSANATQRTHIKNLKKKLESNACNVIIETTRNEGYKFIASW